MASVLRYTAKLSLWVCCGLLVLIVLLAGLVVWRLAAGPIPISFLTPYLERALDSPLSGRRIDLQDTVLAWDAETRRLDLLAQDATILDTDGAVLATFPKIGVALSLRALLRGTIAVTAVNLEGARISLIRNADGAFRLGAGAGQTARPSAKATGSKAFEGFSQLLPVIADELMSEPSPSQPLAYLQTVRIEQGTITVHDAQRGMTWEVPRADLELRRAPEGLIGDVHLTLAAGDAPSSIDARWAYSRSTARLSLEVSLTDLRPSIMPTLMPIMQEVSGLNLPLNGTIDLSLDLQGKLHGLNFQLAGTSGSISHPMLLPSPKAISSLRARGHLDVTHRTVYLDDVTIALGTSAAIGPIIKINGSAEGLGRDITVKGQVVLNHFRLAELKDYWPAGFNDKLRTSLVKNLTLGTVEQAKGHLELLLPQRGLDALTVKALDGALHYRLPLQNSVSKLDATWDFNPSTKKVVADASFTMLRPSALAQVMPSLSPLAGIDVPLNGNFAFSLDPQGGLPDITFNLSGGPGELSLPDVLPAPRPIAKISARGRLDGKKRTLRVDNIMVDLSNDNTAGPIIGVKATVQGLGKHLTANGRVTLKQFRIAELKNYWPVGISNDARIWLTANMVDGFIDAAAIDLRLSRPAGNSGSVNVDRLDGTLQFRGIEVHYVRPLPPLIDVQGTARFNQQGFRIKIASGTGPDLQLTGGDVYITGLDDGHDAIDIRVGIDTPIRATLTLLDSPKLDLISDLGIDPARTGGHARLQTKFAFSLRGDIQIDKVDIKVNGRLEDVVIRDVALGHDVEQGHLTLSLDNAGMTVKGTARFADVPLTVTWQEAFTKQAAWRTEIRAVASRMDQADLVRFGVDLPGRIAGPFATTLTAKIARDGKIVLQGDMNVQEAALAIPSLGWHKPAGEAGEGQGTLRLDGSRGLATANFKLKAGTLATRGTVRIDSSQGGLTHLQLHDLRVDGTHLSDVTLQRRDDRYDLMIGEGVLDVQPLMQARQEGQENRQESPADRTGSSKTEAGRGDKPARRLHLRAPALRRVYFGPDRYLQDVRAELTHGETGWELIDIAGRIPDSLVQYTQAEKKTIDKEGKRPPPGTFTIDYKPSPSGAHELSVQTNDVGSMLRALNLRDSVIGGRMTMQGHTRDAEPNRPLRTTVEVTNVTVTDAPMLARVLAAASFTGLLSSLDQEGLGFSRVTADLTLEKGVISSKLTRAYGGALGLTAEGRVDLAAGNLDVNGTVIPAHLLNTLPGKIPLIGKLIVGGKGRGLVAVNYHVQGKLAEPKVSVNPASALTPGFLRGIFGLFKSSGNDDAEPPPPSPSVQQNPR